MSQTLGELLKKAGEKISKIKVRDVVLALLGIFLLIFTISSVSNSKKKVTELTVTGDSLVGSDAVALLASSSELTELKLEEAWLVSRVAAAKSSLFTLEVSVPDSTLSVCLDGTSLYEIKASSLNTGNWFKNLPPSAKIALVSEPVKLLGQWATIEKEPIVVKQAPKDTIEAAAPQTVPDTIISKPVMLLLTLENNITIAIMQDNRDMKGYNRYKDLMMMKLGLKRAGSSIGGLFSREKKKYYPLITVEAPERSCETLYRALPDTALVVLKINM